MRKKHSICKESKYSEICNVTTAPEDPFSIQRKTEGAQPVVWATEVTFRKWCKIDH